MVQINARNTSDEFDANIGGIQVAELKVRQSPLTGFFSQPIDITDQNHSVKSKTHESSERAVENKISDGSEKTNDRQIKPKNPVNSDQLKKISKDRLIDEKLKSSPVVDAEPPVIPETNEPVKALNLTQNVIRGLPIDSKDSVQEDSTEENSTFRNNSSTFSTAEEKIDPDALPFLTSDFFANSMSIATIEEDPMGTQRLLQVKDSRFSPSLTTGTAFKHTSNPDKQENPERENSTTIDISVGINLGLGEYAIGDYFVCTPAASLMQMRTYNDPLKKFDKEMRVYDADVLIAGFTAPFVLPNDYTFTFSHSYVAPSTFRGKKNMISYSNTPTLTLTKNLPLEDGDMLILVAGVSYTFSNGDTLEEQISDPVYYNFLSSVMEAGGGSPAFDYPANLQDGFTIMLSASYMIPYSERISLVPSISYQSFTFTEGINDGRVDETFNIGISASYLWYEWLSLSLMANYTSKTSNNINTPEFDDFIFGGGINVNHSF